MPTLRTPGAGPRRYRRILGDVAPAGADENDDAPDRQTRLSWREAVTHQVSQTCAAYFDEHQAAWQPDRAQGLYDFWRDPTRADDDPLAWLMTATVLTTTAEDAVGMIHDRMPLFVERERWHRGGGGAEPAGVRSLLTVRRRASAVSKGE